ncbi:hypothetical protein C8Q75DRAFT_410687 [Abortiporus biennis]|nr:hypothetical protein C8Q75DRAFT_410687 [Abortiporus biennis]
MNPMPAVGDPMTLAPQNNHNGKGDDSELWSPGPRFPPEIFDMIIDQLSDDRKALQNCALTCKSWVPRSQIHIHQSVQLSFKLLRSLTGIDVSWYSSPSILSLVRRVEVRRMPARRPSSSENGGIYEDSPLLRSSYPHFIHRLQKLVHASSVKSLSLRFVDGGCMHYFSPLHLAITSLSLHYCPFPSVSRLTSFLRQFRNLRKLSISNPLWPPVNVHFLNLEDRLEHSDNRLRLIDLRIDTLSVNPHVTLDISTGLSQILEKGCISEFHYTARNASILNADNHVALLSSMSDSLHDLYIHMSTSSLHPDTVFPGIDTLNELKRLTIVDISPVHRSVVSPVTMISRVIENILNSIKCPTIMEVAFQFNTQTKLSGFNLESIDGILSQHPFMNVSRIKFSFPHKLNEFNDTIVGIIGGRLSQAVARGVVDIAFESRLDIDQSSSEPFFGFK